MKKFRLISNITVLTVSIFFFLFFSSCANYYYSPNDGDLVTLRKKHDGHISAATNLGADEGKKVLNVQAGYSPINHLAFAGSYFKTSEGETDSRYGDGYILNGAIGGYYFLPINSQRERKRRRISSYPHLDMNTGVLVDLYLGSGEGKVNNFYTVGGRSHFRFRKNYVQLGLHWIKKNWVFSYNVRRGWLNYYNGEVYNRLKINEPDLQKFQDLQIENSFHLQEHSFRINVGISHVRYFMTITSVVGNSDLVNLGVEDNNLTLGLIVEIDEFFREKIKEEKRDLKVEF